ncbi:MAG: hypothetical protein ACO3A2_05700 [Bdellovibrionia bacterium]
MGRFFLSPWITQSFFWVFFFFFSFVTRAEIGFLEMKGVHQYIRPQFEYLSPVYGFVFLKSGALRNLRFYGNYTVPEALGEKVAARDATALLLQLLFPSPDGTTLVPSQVPSQAVTHFSSKTIGKLLSFAMRVRVDPWAHSDEQWESDLVDLLMKDFSEEEESDQTDLLFFPVTLTAAEVMDDAAKMETVKKQRNWKKKHFKRFASAWIGAIYESLLQAPAHYAPYTPEHALLSFFWLRGTSKRDFLSLFKHMDSALSDSGLRLSTDRALQRQFLSYRAVYTPQDYRLWSSRIDQLKKGFFLGDDLRNQFVTFLLDDPEQTAVMSYYSYLYSNQFPPLIPYGISHFDDPISHENKVYADCGETSVLNFMNYFVYDHESQALDVGVLLQAAKKRGLVLDERLVQFYSKNKDIFNLKKQELREEWSTSVIAGLPDARIIYQQQNCELGVGLANVIRIFKNLIFSRDPDFEGLKKSQQLDRICEFFSSDSRVVSWAEKPFRQVDRIANPQTTYAFGSAKLVDQIDKDLELEFFVNGTPLFAYYFMPRHFSITDQSPRKMIEHQTVIFDALFRELQIRTGLQISSQPQANLLYLFVNAEALKRIRWRNSSYPTSKRLSAEPLMQQLLYAQSFVSIDSKKQAIKMILQEDLRNLEPLAEKLMMEVLEQEPYFFLSLLNEGRLHRCSFIETIARLCLRLIKAPDYQRSLTYLSIIQGYEALSSYLLKSLDLSGASLRDDQGRNPLHWAVFSGSLRVVQAVIEKYGVQLLKDTDQLALTPIELSQALHQGEIEGYFRALWEEVFSQESFPRLSLTHPFVPPTSTGIQSLYGLKNILQATPEPQQWQGLKAPILRRGVLPPRSPSWGWGARPVVKVHRGFGVR